MPVIVFVVFAPVVVVLFTAGALLLGAAAAGVWESAERRADSRPTPLPAAVPAAPVRSRAA